MVDARIKVFATCLEGREKKDVQRGWGSGAPEDLTREEITLKRGGCLRAQREEGHFRPREQRGGLRGGVEFHPASGNGRPGCR